MNGGTDQILVITQHDPATDDDIEFVNYTPSNLLNRQHRKAVNSFVNSVKRRKLKQIRSGQGCHMETGRAGTKRSGNAPSQHGHSSLVRWNGKGLQHTDLGYFIGGLRTDPFSSYPVQVRDPVRHAVDVYCQVWAPTHIGQYLQCQDDNLLLSELFPLALQHVGLFEALVAWVQCFSSTYYKQDNFLTKEVFYHRGKAITALRTQLMPSSNFSNDAAIITHLFLMGVDYLMGDVTTSETLLRGIYQLVDHGGGLEKLGLKGLTKAMVLRIEREWTKRRNQKSRYTDLTSTESLEYPSHPFRSDLCSAIAKMPKGFRDLALEAMLSIETLQILERMSEWHICTERVLQQVGTPEEITLLQAHEPQVNAQEAYRCLEVLMSSGRGGGIEKCLHYGLIAYCLEVFAQRKFSPELYWVVQDLPMALEQMEPKPIETDCLMWVSVVGAGTCKGSLYQKGSQIMDKLLEDYPRLREWGNMEETLRKFFWYDSLAVEWKKSWDAAVIRRRLARERASESRSPPERTSINTQEECTSPQPISH